MRKYNSNRMIRIILRLDRIYEKVFENKRIIGEFIFLFGERKKKEAFKASLYFINDIV